MTFYEAALRVLEESGGPLLVQEITKRSVDKGFLSHVGKTPEVTMLARLAAMAKRPRDRKLIVTAKDTFALSDWMLPEDTDALAKTGIVEPNPEEDLPPLRPVERHPEPRSEYLRVIGRQGDRKRRDEEKRRRFPPVAEVAFEVLSESQGAIVPSELIARMRSREMVGDELGVLGLLEALAEDNQKRLDDGRRPQFSALRPEGGAVQLSVETQAEAGPSPLEVQTAFCLAAGLPFENGRVALRQRGERPAAVALPAASPEDLALVQTARLAAREAKKGMARVFRKRLADLEAGVFEKACVKLLHAQHFRELKVAKRTKDGPLLTARRRDGSLELRLAVRLVRGNQPVERRHVQELRRDLGHYAANVGLIISAGESRGDARTEALSGGAMVMLWCGDHLSEKFFEGHVGVSVVEVELFEIDEAFFEQARVGAEEAQKRREERHQERDAAQPGRDASASPASDDPQSTGPAAGADRPSAPRAAANADQASPVDAGPSDGDDGDADGDDDEGEGEGDAAEGGAGGAASATSPEGAGEGGRRRRRRRRRRGRGPKPEGQTVGAEGGAAPAPAASAPQPPPASTAPSGGGGEGS